MQKDLGLHLGLFFKTIMQIIRTMGRFGYELYCYKRFEWTPGVGDGQGGLAYCDSWGCKESDTTEGLNWTELMFMLHFLSMIDCVCIRECVYVFFLGDTKCLGMKCHIYSSNILASHVCVCVWSTDMARWGQLINLDDHYLRFIVHCLWVFLLYLTSLN